MMMAATAAESGGSAAGSFGSAAEEAAYWKRRTEELMAEMKETKEEFQEFQDGSRELEAELETQLEQSERKVKEYRSLSNRLHMENDELKAKLEQSHKEYAFQISELQTELSEIKSIKDELNKYVRQLEQQNDDLERAKRSTLASLEDFEVKMNATIERNAFLESELDEKESLQAAVQRLKDETRDLRQELRIVTAPAPTAGQHAPHLHHHQATPKRAFSLDVQNTSQLPSAAAAAAAASAASATAGSSLNGSLVNVPDNDKSSQQQQDSNRNHSSSNVPLTPSARQSALNIVGDLLKKVGALGLELSSCRNIVKENSGNLAVGGGGGGSGGSGGMGSHGGGVGHHLGHTQSSSANNLAALASSNICSGFNRKSSSTSKPSSPK